MQKEKFIKKHSATWDELETITKTIKKKGTKNLSSQEIKQFLYLFRQSSRHLAYARTHYPNSDIISYLNNLISESHSHVYAVKKLSPAKLLNYITHHFPQLLKKYNYYLLISFATFALGAIIGLAMVFYNPDQAGFFLPNEYIDAIKDGTRGGGEWNYPLMSSYIMVNNITVALRAFVFGITLGLGTLYVLFYNGALLGALTALVYLYDNPLEYWSLILPHGVIELPAIWISGAAGLIIAKHLLLPGEYTRKDSFIFGAKKAVSLVIGIIILLIIAGLIEGFYTPLKIGVENKLIFSAVVAILFSSYCLLPYVKKQ